MKKIFLLFFVFIISVSISSAKTAPVSVRLPEAKAWTGQRLPFFIELRAAGSFDGAASFDLPQVEGTIIIKIGSPVVSSEDIDGGSWFVQAHEFALFSQKTGRVEVPQFPVRFASRSGFTGAASGNQAKFPGMEVTIQRPPGSENIGFLITTESLKVTESWTPQPGPTQAGAIFKRTISQRASELSGMALSPAPVTVPEGIKVYTEDARIQDKTERGDFTGERSETVTYQVTRAGGFALPELTYVWWNPKTEKMEKTTLPAVSFSVAAAPSSTSALIQSKIKLKWLVLLILLLSFAVFQREKILTWMRQWWKRLHPADKALAKKLIRACRQNHGAAANQAWIGWKNSQEYNFQHGDELQSAVLSLQRHLYGSEPAEVWNGEELARTFTSHLKTQKSSVSGKKISVLPRLNM